MSGEVLFLKISTIFGIDYFDQNRNYSIFSGNQNRVYKYFLVYFNALEKETNFERHL